MRTHILFAAAGLIITGAFASGSLGQATLPVEASIYPYLIVNPRLPAEGDDVSLRIVKDMHTNGCVPVYSSVRYVITQRPEEIFPPNYDLDLYYTETWPSDDLCTAVMTKYGPSATVPAKELSRGTYFVNDGDTRVGTFTVARPLTISGRITDDPSPTKRAPLPISGARIILYRQQLILLKAAGPIPDPDYYFPVDTAESGENGQFAFDSLREERYLLDVSAGGFLSKSTSLYATRDTAVSVMLVREQQPGASSTEIVDGVEFSIAADRAAYRWDDTLRVRYAVSNQSMATVRYDFTSGCQFDMELADSHGQTVYRYLASRGCTDALTAITLAPGESTEFHFQPVPLDKVREQSGKQAFSDGMAIVSAHMVGYDQSTVSVGVTVSVPDEVRVASSRSRHTAPHVTRVGRELLIALNRAQRIRIEPFLPSGARLGGSVFDNMLGAGVHTIAIPVDAGSPIVFLRISGDTFSTVRKALFIR